MKSLRLFAGALLSCAIAPAFAGPVTTTYNFKTMASSVGGTWSTSASGYNATNGTNYGNTATYDAISGAIDPVNVSAWGSTGGVGGYNGTLQSAYLSHYTSGSGANTKYELAITSRPDTGNAELNSSHRPNTSNNQHAIDNAGGYEALLYSFQSAVTLNTVSIGFPSGTSTLDSDATVLVYTGQGDPTAGLSTRTFADLVRAGGGWVVAGNLMDMARTGGVGTLNTTQSSKYWMVGAYMGIGGNSMTNVTGNNDYIKVSGLTVSALVVPEPDSLALAGIAGVALLATRRRRAKGR